MKKALLLISALVLSGTMSAQTDKKNAVVNVENDYTPEVMEVTKKSFTPKDDTSITAATRKVINFFMLCYNPL